MPTYYKYGCFIDGQHVALETLDNIDRKNPRDGTSLASYPRCGSQEINAAVRSAVRAMQPDTEWCRLSNEARHDLLLAAANLLASSEQELARIEADETGKPITDALGDIRSGIRLWRYAAASLRSLGGEYYPNLATGTQGLTLLEPVGVVALILPWNFPFIVSSERLPFMLAAGCPVVIKPSEFASGTAIKTGQLLHLAGFPPGTINVVTGYGPEAGQALVEHPEVAMISFTGSTDNGRQIMASAAKTLKRVSLELGGKSPIIVFADANLEAAAEAVINGFTHNAGQCCIATSRLVLDRSIAEAFRNILKTQLEKLVRDDAFVQPLATAGQLSKVTAFVARAREEGRCVFSPSETGPENTIQPHIFDSLPENSSILRDEIFGPVLAIQYFDNDDEAIGLANDTKFGLAACIWTRNNERAMRIAHQVRAGRLWINSPQINFPELPVGGFGMSGIGREAGSSGIRSYCETKSIIIQHSP